MPDKIERLSGTLDHKQIIYFAAGFHNRTCSLKYTHPYLFMHKQGDVMSIIQKHISKIK